MGNSPSKKKKSKQELEIEKVEQDKNKKKGNERMEEREENHIKLAEEFGDAQKQSKVQNEEGRNETSNRETNKFGSQMLQKFFSLYQSERSYGTAFYKRVGEHIKQNFELSGNAQRELEGLSKRGKLGDESFKRIMLGMMKRKDLSNSFREIRRHNSEEKQFGELFRVEGKEQLGLLQLLDIRYFENKECYVFRSGKRLAFRERGYPILSIEEPFLQANKFSWPYFLCSETEETKMVKAEIESREFPFLKLPKVIWSEILFFFSVKELAVLCEVSKQFSKAVSHDSHWRARFMRDVDWLGDVQGQFEEKRREEKMTWKKLYEETRPTKVLVFKLIKWHTNTCDLLCTVYVSPKCTVGKFFDICARQPDNLYSEKMNGQFLFPLAPSDVSWRQEQVSRLKIAGESQPNCKLEFESLQTNVIDAGLCDGACLAFWS